MNICENSHLCYKLESLKCGGGQNFKEYNLTLVINIEVSKDSSVYTELYIVGYVLGSRIRKECGRGDF